MESVKRRNTKQKEHILEIFKNNSDNHFTAEEVSQELLKNSIEIGQATVYRIIRKLTEDGKIRKYISDVNKCACYQYVFSEGCERHIHVICDRCNKLIHTSINELSEIKSELMKNEDFELNMQKVVLYGKCKDCKKGSK